MSMKKTEHGKERRKEGKGERRKEIEKEDTYLNGDRERKSWSLHIQVIATSRV